MRNIEHQNLKPQRKNKRNKSDKFGTRIENSHTYGKCENFDPDLQLDIKF